MAVPQALLFGIDGVPVTSWAVLPGAVESIRAPAWLGLDRVMPNPTTPDGPPGHGDDLYEALGVLRGASDAEIKQAYAGFDTPRPGAKPAHRVVLSETQWRDGASFRSPIDGGLVELPRFTPQGPYVIAGRGGEGANRGPRGELPVLVEHATPEPFTSAGAAPTRGLGQSFRWAAGVVTLGVLLAAAIVLAAAALLRAWGVYAG